MNKRNVLTVMAICVIVVIAVAGVLIWKYLSAAEPEPVRINFRQVYSGIECLMDGESYSGEAIPITILMHGTIIPSEPNSFQGTILISNEEEELFRFEDICILELTELISYVVPAGSNAVAEGDVPYYAQIAISEDLSRVSFRNVTDTPVEYYDNDNESEDLVIYAAPARSKLEVYYIAESFGWIGFSGTVSVDKRGAWN